MRAYSKEKYDKIVSKAKSKQEKENNKLLRRHQKAANKNSKYIAEIIVYKILKARENYYMVNDIYGDVFDKDIVLDIVKKKFPFLYFKYEILGKKKSYFFNWSEEPFTN